MKERIRAILEEIVGAIEYRLEETGCLTEDDFNSLEKASDILRKLEAVNEVQTLDADVVDIGLKELRAAASPDKSGKSQS